MRLSLFVSYAWYYAPTWMYSAYCVQQSLKPVSRMWRSIVRHSKPIMHLAWHLYITLRVASGTALGNVLHVNSDEVTVSEGVSLKWYIPSRVLVTKPSDWVLTSQCIAWELTAFFGGKNCASLVGSVLSPSFWRLPLWPMYVLRALRAALPCPG